jgi:hypothetical protein
MIAFRPPAIHVGLGLALSLSALPAMAQDDDQREAERGTIVVEGERIESRDVRETARDITAPSASSGEPLARFQREICVGVWGLQAENAQLVIDRIYDNADRADIPVDTAADCGANVWVIVVDDPAATFARLHEQDSFMTRHLSRAQRRAVEAQEGATRAWNVVSYRNRDGQPIASPEENADNAFAARAAGEPPPANPNTNMSRLESAIRLDIELGVVLIARSELASLDAYSIADYATMRLLAQTEPPSREQQVDTVLTLFEPGVSDDAPRYLTLFDRAYLESIYDSSPTRPGRLALGRVAEEMQRGVD